MTDALWYLGRGTGVSALVLFTLTMVLGLVLPSGRSLPGLPRFAVAALHRTISLTALTLLVVHVTTLYLDPYAQLRLADVVVPFRGAYRPLWLGLGTLAGDLVVVLIATSLLRRHIGQRIWRMLHWAAYACWPLALGHALGNGTDRAAGWMIWVAIGCAAAVAATLTWRVAQGQADKRAAERRAARTVSAPPYFAGHGRGRRP
ncbi:MAG: ferric reductase-like transmembrane domain-containing protein [Lapillicoccus sp.]